MPSYAESGRLPFGSAARDYFMGNRDVMDAYKRDNLGLNPDDFAKLHWKLYGQQEGRYFRGLSSPKSITQNPYFREAPSSAPAANSANALKYLYGEPSGLSSVERRQATRIDTDKVTQLRNAMARRVAPDTYAQGYFDRNPDVWEAYQADPRGLTRNQFAREHYNRYGKAEGRTWEAAAQSAPSGQTTWEGGKAGGLATPQGFALGGLGSLNGYAGGGGTLGDYSDGGRLLRGPGDGVSDSIPATIAGKQPARLADGEFVIPARIVSELGNGSTQAGARQLYAMMDRIQARRGKTVGKDQVAVDSKARKLLPV